MSRLIELQYYSTNVGLPIIKVCNDKGEDIPNQVAIIGMDSLKEIELIIDNINEELGIKTEPKLFRFSLNNEFLVPIEEELTGLKTDIDGLAFYIGDQSYITGILATVS